MSHSPSTTIAGLLLFCMFLQPFATQEDCDFSNTQSPDRDACSRWSFGQNFKVEQIDGSGKEICFWIS